jgi:hypothetical protein
VRRTAAFELVALRLNTGEGSEYTVVRSATGGAISANVNSTQVPEQPYPDKRLGRILYEDLSIEIASSMGPELFAWIAKSWGTVPPASDGAILRCDFNYKIDSATDFQRALVAETGFPAFDANTKESALLLVLRLVPTTLVEHGVSPPGALSLAHVDKQQNAWLHRNYRLEIDGLDCTRVSRIGPFTVRRQIDVEIGQAGRPELHFGPVLFPNLQIFLASATVESWSAWHQDFVIEGHNGPTFEKTGSIQLLTPDLKRVLYRLDLSGLGIFRLVPEPQDRRSGLIQRHEADLYCQRITLSRFPGG